MSGFVSLVGAGPGDPDLLTLRAVDRLRRADLVLYDALVEAELLELAPQAKRFYVGKRAGRHSIDQDGIHRLMVRAAQRGERVVRLAQPLRTRGVTVNVETTPAADLDRDLGADLVEVTHRCVQELLRNVQRHADARHVEVSVVRTQRSLVLCVQDDGRGMDPAAAVESEHGHLGLQALADIATDHRGSLELWSEVGAGTDVRMEL